MPLDIRIRFDRAIRRLREEQNINQEEAAKRCGVHRTCTGRYLSGFGVYQKLADQFGDRPKDWNRNQKGRTSRPQKIQSRI